MSKLEKPIKSLVILWNWGDLWDKEKSSDEIAVGKNGTARIIRVGDSKLHSELTLSNLLEIPKQYNFKTTDESIFLLHATSIHQTTISELKKELTKKYPNISDNSFIKFGGGQSYIYHQPELGRGLLNQEDNFYTTDTIKYIKDSVTKKRIRIKPSVVDWNEDATKYTIKTDLFKDVWNYYKNESKRELFEFYEHFLIFLIGRRITNDDLPNFFAKPVDLNKSLEAGMKKLLDKVLWEGRFKDFYQKDEDKINKKYENLLSFLNNHYSELMQASQNVEEDFYLIQLRHHFANLLNLMPERIYD